MLTSDIITGRYREIILQRIICLSFFSFIRPDVIRRVNVSVQQNARSAQNGGSLRQTERGQVGSQARTVDIEGLKRVEWMWAICQVRQDW